VDNDECAYKDADGFTFAGESNSCAEDRGLGASVRVTCHSLEQWSLAVFSDRSCSASRQIDSQSGVSGKCVSGSVAGFQGSMMVRCGATPQQAASLLQADAIAIQDDIDADKKKKKIGAIGTNA